MKTDKTYFDLYEMALIHEREQAPGGETALWGAFLVDTDRRYGVPKHAIHANADSDAAQQIVLPVGEYEAWDAAYRQMAVWDAEGREYEIHDLF